MNVPDIRELVFCELQQVSANSRKSGMRAFVSARNSGPVVSSQTDISCTFQIFWNRCFVSCRNAVNIPDNRKLVFLESTTS